MPIQFRHGNLPRLHRCLVALPIKERIALLVIQPCGRSFFKTVRSTPVRDHKSRKLPVPFQHFIQQVIILAGKDAIHAVIRAHHSVWVALLDANLKGEQVALPRRPFVDIHIDPTASALLVIERIVFDVADDVLRLNSGDQPGHYGPCQHGVFAQILKRPPVARFARNIHAAAERHIVALRPQLTPDERTIFKCCRGIPACRQRHIGGQGCRIAPVLRAASHAVSRVAHIERRNPQPRNPNPVAPATVRQGGHGSKRIEHRHPISMQELDLLVQRHFFHHQIGALVR